MKVASVSELKAHLSRYLRVVKRGGEVQVLERGVPVARLVGVAGAPAGDAARLDRWVRSGLVRPGRGDARWILEREPARTGRGTLGEALDAERADRV